MSRGFLTLFIALACCSCSNKVEEKRSYYPSGELREIWSEDRHGLKNGLATTHYPNGQKQTEATFKNDYLHGRFRMWNTGGYLIADGDYKNGQPWSGTFVVGDQFKGHVLFREYKDGKLVGDVGPVSARSATPKPDPEALAGAAAPNATAKEPQAPQASQASPAPQAPTPSAPAEGSGVPK